MVGVDAGLAGLQAAVDVGAFDLQAVHKPLLAATGPVDPSATSVLDEAESKAMLASYGIQVPTHRVVGSAREAVAAARHLGFPVAVKACGIAHKTESGGVMLGLTDEKEVKQAAEALLQLGECCLVEKMVDGVIAELIIGVARDEQFGPYLLVGSGGVLVEVLKDTKSLLLPLDRRQVMQALDELKCAPLLQGYRGQDRCDLEAVVEAVLAVAALVEHDPAGIAELDINPLMVRAEGRGAIAADALISMYVDDRDYDEPAGSNEHV